MDQRHHDLHLRIDRIERTLMFEYSPGSPKARFDICDVSGRIVKSGEVHGGATSVRIAELDGQEYYLMVLDGELGTLEPFQLQHA